MQSLNCRIFYNSISFLVVSGVGYKYLHPDCITQTKRPKSAQPGHSAVKLFVKNYMLILFFVFTAQVSVLILNFLHVLTH